MQRRTQRLEQLRGTIREISAPEAEHLRAHGALLLDVRELDEVAAGTPRGATHLNRGFLELKIEELAPDADATIVLMCGGGVRSLFAAEGLQQMGYTDVRSLAGGFRAWKEAALPVEIPQVLRGEERERYARHLTIPEVGEAGQRKLLASRVLLVGAGGLGSPAALYLAAAGVGELRLVDDDLVDRSNLQRQILHRDDRIGTPKADSARATLSALNPGIRIDARQARLGPDNVEELFEGCDLVVDGADNFATRYLVNDAAVHLGLPNVHGSIHRFEGQVGTFHPRHGGPCYRCLFPSPPPAELAPNCAEAGVFGVLPGVIGCLQAVEAIKLLLGIGEPLIGRLLSYDALAAGFFELRLERRADCPVCGANAEFRGYVLGGEACSTTSDRGRA